MISPERLPTNIKAIIFDSTGQTVARASVPTPTHYPHQVTAYSAYFRDVYQPPYPTLRSLHHTIHQLQNEAPP